MKRIPHPQKYDFLWLGKNMTYFQTSFWLNKEYRKRDFLITCQGENWKTYIGKEERKKLSRYGIYFLEKKLDWYEKNTKKTIKKLKQHFQKIKKIKISKLSLDQLSRRFLETAKIVQKGWGVYFWTEYFLHDEVEKKIREKAPEAKKLLQAIRRLQKIKFSLRKVLNQTIFPQNIFEKYLKEIARRTKTNVEKLSFLSYQEIIKFLKEKRFPPGDRKSFVLGKFNNWKPLFGKEAEKIIERFERVSPNLRFLKGEVAYPGRYRGRVQIIFLDLKADLKKKITKMKKGDVLVAGTTGPEMILACQKAGAIITEEGGICSHAALISRELKIPCLIGTKIATRILREGDLVEVDAIEGVVRLLKRSSKK